MLQLSFWLAEKDCVGALSAVPLDLLIFQNKLEEHLCFSSVKVFRKYSLVKLSVWIRLSKLEVELVFS